MITPFQKLLKQKPRPVAVTALRDRLDVDRSTFYRWGKGKPYPPYPMATQIIDVLAEFGVAMDYNGIYQASLSDTKPEEKQ